ncbi:MAG: L-2,4-diaminobutyrate decarboxylase [Pirellulaceae bacterium]|nr:MAG: L-2,4-diaminobutyrate decarboxylase [Pirellulaceae bacterium]
MARSLGGIVLNEDWRSVYDPEEFRRQGHRLIDLLADYWERSLSGAATDPVLPWQDPQEAVEFWTQMQERPGTLVELVEQVLARSVAVLHPRYLGHQIAVPTPLSALASLVVDCLNNGCGVYEMGMVGAAMERIACAQLALRVGFPATAGGFLTGGGTLANLTALLAARARHVEEVWERGTTESLTVLVSDQAHYSIDRAVRVMGWGASGITRVPVDEKFCLRTDMLGEAYREARSAGRRPIAVVGTAATTATGAVDDLAAIADFCRKHELWFHVDAAHGGAMVFSRRHRPRLEGIEQADSVVIDFHKMLMTPALASALIFRRHEDSRRTFSTHAEYLFDSAAQAPRCDDFDTGRRTFECTKSMMAVKVFVNLALHGWEVLEANVDRLLEMAQRFADMIESHPRFELATRPQSNIVCFRFTGVLPAHRDQCNALIRQRLVTGGSFYIVQTRLAGELWLRCTITNPLTSPHHFRQLLAELDRLAAAVHLDASHMA